MIAALGEQLENGHLQMYCVDSVDEESWYAWHKHPPSAPGGTSSTRITC